MKILEKMKGVEEPKALRYHLHKLLAGRQTARDPAVVHASELMNEEREFCVREHVLLQDHPDAQRTDPFVTTAQNVTYQMSRLTQDLITDWVAQTGHAFGDWECLGCEHVFTFRKRPARCSHCGVKLFRYRETVWHSQYCWVSGSIDLLVDMGEPLLRVVELKAIQPSDFKKLEGPLAEHRWRTNLYMRLIHESGDPRAKRINTEQAWVLYTSKGGWGVRDPRLALEWGLADGAWSPFKEFAVQRNDADTDKYVERARLRKIYREGGPMPARICAALANPRAQDCHAMHVCFSKELNGGD